MNFFYHNDDPLLSRYQSTIPTNLCDPQNMMNETYVNLCRQQMMQQQCNNEVMRDWVGELDKCMKKLQSEVVEQLNNNEEFTQLNQIIQREIQTEIMSIVKFKLNSSPIIQNNIKRQMEIINEVSEHTQDEERKNMNELNDYLKNYSHLTFDEYKKTKKKAVKNEKG